ncbi:hypothetical protein VTI28DRAFT_5633 [Corynascus sepedonium]
MSSLSSFFHQGLYYLYYGFSTLCCALLKSVAVLSSTCRCLVPCHPFSLWCPASARLENHLILSYASALATPRTIPRHLNSFRELLLVSTTPQPVVPLSVRKHTEHPLSVWLSITGSVQNVGSRTLSQY